MRYSCKKCDIEYARTFRLTHPESLKQYEKEYIRKNPRRRWAIACLAGHRRRGYTIEMTSKDLYALAAKTERCYVCEAQLEWQLGNKGRMNNRSPTLDRSDNEDVIRSDNVLILCYQCNATKRDRTLKEFQE
jgi:hypothetical protein